MCVPPPPPNEQVPYAYVLKHHKHFMGRGVIKLLRCGVEGMKGIERVLGLGEGGGRYLHRPIGVLFLSKFSNLNLP